MSYLYKKKHGMAEKPEIVAHAGGGRRIPAPDAATDMQLRQRITVLENVMSGGELRYALSLAAHGSQRRAENETGLSASYMSSKPDIVEYVDLVRELRYRRLDVTGEAIAAELATIAFSDVTDVLTSVEGGGVRVKDLAGMRFPGVVKKVSVHVSPDGEAKIISLEMHNKLDALKTLARYHTMGRWRRDVRNNGHDMPEKPTTIVHINHRLKGEDLAE